MRTAKTTRVYRMEERAASRAATRQRIIDATKELWLERWYDEMTLREIAARAGVALQTVVNHFGNKDGIVTATLEQPIPEEWMGRMAAEPDDIPGAIDLLIEDYERVGDASLRSLALEGRVSAVRPLLDRGRGAQREWIQSTFPAALTGLRGAARERRVTLLVCATDVYTWKLLRRDRQLSQAQTARAIRELVEAVIP